MERVEITEFSGVSGQVVARAMGVTSMISGIALGLTIMVGGFVLMQAETPAAVMPFVQIVVTLAMARFALNGMFGEWNGTVFSGAGGSWAQVVFVAGRYLALTAIWFVPMLIFGGLPQDNQEWMMMMMGGGGQMVGAFGLYILAMTLTPPLFLIAAVSANGFGDLVSGDHWRGLFSGRMRDLFAVYVVYTGGFVMMMVLSIPFVVLAFMANPKLGLFMLGVTFCFMMGVSANLLGRLCGFFACGELGLLSSGESDVGRPGVSPGAPRAAGAPARASSMPTAPPVTAVPTVPPVQAVPAAPASLPLSGAAAAATPVASVAGSAAAGPAVDPTATVRLSAEEVSQAVGGAPPVAAATAAQPAPIAPQRPPLLDGQQRVESLMPRVAQEPQAVLAALEELHASFAPQQHVMYALAVVRLRCGQLEQALPMAREAIETCFERHQPLLAAQVFVEFRQHLQQLNPSQDQLVKIGNALAKNDQLSTAAKAFSAVINVDPEEVRAVKGLLQVADEILQKKGRPEAAIKVYQFLLNHCAGSPLVEYIRSGLEECERKLAHPHPQ